MKPHNCRNSAALLVPALVLLLVMIWSDPVNAGETKPPVSTLSASETAIRTIRQEVQSIEKNAPKFRRLAIPWEGRSTEGGELIGYFQGPSLRKVVEDVFGETGRSITELYFQSNRLIFAVSTTIHYKRPLNFDEKTKDLEIESRVQERCWFAQGRLIAAAGGDGKMIPIASPKAKSRAEKFTATAKEATAALSKTKPRTLFDDQPGKHPVEAKVNALAQQARCTLDETIVTCMATQLWDDELNRVYRELRGKLAESDAMTLQDAQRKWIAWRDAEFKITDRLYGEQPGTMFQPMSEQHKMWIVRSRALDLQNWLEMRENYLKHRREMDEMEKGLK
jgi:uncharacterized protein YecT (DUF1311 family)